MIGLAGIPLAAALTYTTQAVVLLAIMNRKYPGLLDVRSTALRAAGAALAAAAIVGAVHFLAPIGSLPKVLLGLAVGTGAVVPLVWRELRLLFNL
jgi:peptidoglycan biosynthesis protein MviN/MurJ (putative lipid II flippase)